MKNFLLGLFLGLILATGFTAMAQLAPFDAPLHDQLNGQRAEQYLNMQRSLERMEQGLYSDPLLAMPGGPCRK